MSCIPSLLVPSDLAKTLFKPSAKTAIISLQSKNININRLVRPNLQGRREDLEEARTSSGELVQRCLDFEPAIWREIDGFFDPSESQV